MKSLIAIAVLCAGLASAQEIYQDRGMGDVALTGAALIPHSDPSAATGILEAEGGFFVTRGLLIDAAVIGVFNQVENDVFIAGGASYFFGAATSKLRPFVGVAMGANVISVAGASNNNLLAAGSAGFRYYLARHVALQLAYEFDWIHISGASLKDSSQSVITVGFAHVF